MKLLTLEDYEKQEKHSGQSIGTWPKNLVKVQGRKTF